MIRSRALTSLLLFALLATAAAADWPRYRGDGTGVAAETGLARGWADDGPPRLWHRAIGDGFSGMAVVGERLYTVELRDGEQRLVALDAATGKDVWSASFGTDYQDGNGFGHGARSTPTLDGKGDDARVYAISADAILLAVRAAGGEVLWRNDFKETLGAKAPRFGFGTSPLVDGDLVVVETGGTENRAIVAFDKMDGSIRWASQDGPATYATPLPVTLAGRKQYVFNRRVGLVGLDAATGEKLWEHPSARDTIVLPVFVPPDRLFISSATMGDGGHMIRVTHDAENDTWTAEKVWSNARFRNHFNNSVAVGGHLYGFDNATLRCVDLETGEIRWSSRGYGKGSLVAADGLLFVLSDRGLLALVEASPEAFRELGRVQAMDGRAWTSPTLDGGRLFVRDHDEIAAYDVRGAGRAEAAARKVARADAAPELPRDAAPDADEVVRRYVAARGGAENWAKVRTLVQRGNYATFSKNAPFTERHVRGEDGDLFRLDFQTLDGPGTWARDAEGPWWIFPMVGPPTPMRLTEPPAVHYIRELERRSALEPLLVRHEEKGVRVDLDGTDTIADRTTVRLKVTLGEDHEEVWHLDPETWLEVAVDRTVYDFSQGRDPFEQRTYFSDFRKVDGGIVLPHQLALEFGARLEDVRVDEVEVNAGVDASVFAFPGAEDGAATPADPDAN